MDPGTLAQEIAGLELANAALIDCTAASSIVDAYPAFIKANLHIITPNKRANVLPWRRYAALQDAAGPPPEAVSCVKPTSARDCRSSSTLRI